MHIKLWVMAVGFASFLRTLVLAGQKNKTVTAADRISLSTVHLRCQAAPDIGCGPISKPITTSFGFVGCAAADSKELRKPCRLTFLVPHIETWLPFITKLSSGSVVRGFCPETR